LAVGVAGFIQDDLRLAGWRTPGRKGIGPPPPPSDPARGAANATAGPSRSRARRQTLSIPPGAVVGIIPKFGWLLYEGSDNEELDFTVETEFLYRFPYSSETQVGENRYDESYDHGLDTDGWFAIHRQKRMIRDKAVVYKGLANVFNRLGLEGKACLLKTVCEIAGSPLLYDGLIGELLNIALIPSHTVDGTPDELDEYRQAEQLGSSGRDCRAAFSPCPISLFRQIGA
ncbi:uncharacterized protein LOC119103761, partial [Pollicipes pollicipes]|uniref:uncharacterized protein LOC119103761 n=1 Tax=Pollicipes pollicipes TaxID=41117 RepID=UPI0018856B1D